MVYVQSKKGFPFPSLKLQKAGKVSLYASQLSTTVNWGDFDQILNIFIKICLKIDWWLRLRYYGSFFQRFKCWSKSPQFTIPTFCGLYKPMDYIMTLKTFNFVSWLYARCFIRLTLLYSFLFVYCLDFKSNLAIAVTTLV